MPRSIIHISGAVILGISLSACNNSKEPTAADFTALLKNTSEQHCTDLKNRTIDPTTYYNNIPNDPNEPKYKMAMRGKLVEPGSGKILKPNAESWADEGIRSAFFLDEPTTELTYLFQKNGKDWQGTPQNQ